MYTNARPTDRQEDGTNTKIQKKKKFDDNRRTINGLYDDDDEQQSEVFSGYKAKIASGSGRLALNEELGPILCCTRLKPKKRNSVLQ